MQKLIVIATCILGFFSTVLPIKNKYFDLESSVAQCVKNYTFKTESKDKNIFLLWLKNLKKNPVSLSTPQINDPEYIRVTHDIIWQNVLWTLAHKTNQVENTDKLLKKSYPFFYVLKLVEDKIKADKLATLYKEAITQATLEFLKNLESKQYKSPRSKL